MNVLDTLHARGLVHQTSDEANLRHLLEGRATVYTGFDPTGASLTAGHLVPIMVLAHLQRAGHRPVVLCGGGTALVGDPSGKTSSRPILTREQIGANLQSQQRQLMSFLDFDADQALVVNNADWLCELNYIEFLRDIGSHFSVNTMLTADVYRTRLDAGEHLSFLEFNYQLLQAYDWLHLYRTLGCTIQSAGSDQWANCLAGKELIRRLEGAEVEVLCAPLLITAAGQKMGKTERGAVWLAADQTSPYEFYQYWVNVDDRDVVTWLKLFTFVSLERIVEVTEEGGAALREAKHLLAYEVTRMVHGEAAAGEAQEAAGAAFGGTGGSRDSMPTTRLTRAEVDAGLPILELLVTIGLAASRAAAKRLVEQGGAYLNGEKVPGPDRTVTTGDVHDGEVLLRSGKKTFHRLVVS
ncbi:MAG: tyrosine--tRNA ligase [Armatimonadetes bacterium]|nr:tyrosine--tRNA ligase [Armatimonadota bacterium]